MGDDGAAVSPRFRMQVANMLRYWRTQSADLDDQAVTALDGERHAIYRALEYGAALDALVVDAGEVAVALFRLVEMRARFNEWIPLLEQLTARLPTHGRLRVRLLNHLGYFLRMRRDHTSAEPLHAAALAICEQCDYPYELGESTYHLAALHQELHHNELAHAYAARTLTTFLQLDPPENRKLGAINNLLGNLDAARGRYDDAVSHFLRAVPYWEAGGELMYLSRTWCNLGDAYTWLHAFDDAVAAYAEAERVLAQVDSPFDVVRALVGRGTVEATRGNVPAAERIWREAYRLARAQSGGAFYEALTATNIGDALLVQRRYIEAAGFLENGLALWQRTDDGMMAAATGLLLAYALAGDGRLQEARQHHAQVLPAVSAYAADNGWLRQRLQKLHTTFPDLTALL